MPDLRYKLSVLADAAKYDASCASSGAKRGGREGALGHNTGVGICHSYTPDGRCVSLLKILLTNHCIYDCQYCVNRMSSDVPRAAFTPAEVADLTMNFYRRNYIEGLFLSSGIIQSPDYTMEQLAQVGYLLREVHRFNGYIHFKAVPGASAAAIALVGRYADRLSANIELPTPADLQRLAPEKKAEAIMQTMGEIRTGILESRDGRDDAVPASIGDEAAAITQRSEPAGHRQFAPAGQSTQMIVGATPTADGTILRTASNLYRRYRLRRVYYSAFSPIPHGDARLPLAPPPLVREHRLYQADWLMRHYGFSAGELGGEYENLPLDVDPKTAWALRHRERFPVDVNRAERHVLLRVPGLGVRNVDRILRIRVHQKLRLADLIKLRVSMKRAKPFVITVDWHPDSVLLDSDRLPGLLREKQLGLFDAVSAVTGEV